MLIPALAPCQINSRPVQRLPSPRSLKHLDSGFGSAISAFQDFRFSAFASVTGPRSRVAGNVAGTDSQSPIKSRVVAVLRVNTPGGGCLASPALCLTLCPTLCLDRPSRQASASLGKLGQASVFPAALVNLKIGSISKRFKAFQTKIFIRVNVRLAPRLKLSLGL